MSENTNVYMYEMREKRERRMSFCHSFLSGSRHPFLRMRPLFLCFLILCSTSSYWFTSKIEKTKKKSVSVYYNHFVSKLMVPIKKILFLLFLFSGMEG